MTTTQSKSNLNILLYRITIIFLVGSILFLCYNLYATQKPYDIQLDYWPVRE